MSAHEPFDRINRRILSLLQNDGRLTAGQIGEAVGLSATPCLRRIRLLEERGVIRGYVAVLDQVELGLAVSVFVSVKLTQQRQDLLDRFNAAIERWPEVVDCFLKTGQADYLLRVVVADLPAYERFLRDKLTRLDMIGSIESSFVLKQVKQTHLLPIPD